MLTLIAKNIGQGNGASLSALDVLVSLGQIDPKMELIYLYKQKIPKIVDGKSVLYSKSYLSPRTFNEGGPLSLKKISNMIIEPLLLKRLHKVSPKMVFINSMGSHTLWLPIKKKYNWPSTLIIRESPQLYQKKNLPLVLDRFNYYNYVIFVSDIVKQKWLDLINIDRNKCFYIPNCIREKKVEHILKKSKLYFKKKIYKNPEKFIAICIGEVKFRKGQDLLINNLKLICDSIPNFKLIILGRQNKEFLKNIQTSLKNMNLEYIVEFITHKPNALEHIYAADLLIQPSRSEALPRTILEAMALKTPIIASDVDGIPELVKHEKSAFLFSLTNISQMIVGINKIYSDVLFKKNIVEGANKTYWSKFSRQIHINNYANFIKNIIDE